MHISTVQDSTRRLRNGATKPSFPEQESYFASCMPPKKRPAKHSTENTKRYSGYFQRLQPESGRGAADTSGYPRHAAYPRAGLVPRRRQQSQLSQIPCPKRKPCQWPFFSGGLARVRSPVGPVQPPQACRLAGFARLSGFSSVTNAARQAPGPPGRGTLVWLAG